MAICAYNRPHYLEQTIQSVIAQSYKDIKIIIYDNGSTGDDVAQVVGGFSDPRIFYVRFDQNRKDAFNIIMDRCDTEFLVIFHDDDIMLPHMIETELAEIDKHADAAVCAQAYSSIAQIDTDGNLIKRKQNRYSVFEFLSRKKTATVFKKNELIIDNLKRGGNNISCPSAMFRTAKLNFFNLRFRLDCGPAADWLLWLETNSHEEIVVINKPLLFYRVHDKSDSHLAYEDGRMLESYIYIIKWLSKNGFESGVHRMIDKLLSAGIVHSTIDLQHAKDRIKQIKDEHGLEIPNKCKRRLVTISLSAMAKKVLKKEATIQDYIAERKKAISIIGVPPLFGRELEWLAKCFI